MEFQNSVIDLIKKRTSSRTYESKNIESETLQKLKDFIAEINKDINIKARFTVINNDINNKGSKKLGTYGVISGADTYIIGILDKDDNNAFEFGYFFEKIILCATDLGLQTCWLGGTFNKEDFAQNVDITENEFIPIVSPVGYKKGKARIVETAMRAAAGSNQRKPWNELFFDKDIQNPLTEKDAGPYAVLLEMVRLGPSASNKQPWRIIKDNNEFHFLLSKTKGYGVASYDIQLNDMGIAKCHFDFSAKELGLKGQWQKLDYIKTPEDWEYVTTWVAKV
jgi:nitroreductase